MRFLVDANLPRRLVAPFEAAGHECAHVAIVLTSDTADVDIARCANETASILITKDHDFLDFMKRGVLTGPLVHVGLGNMTAAVTVAILLARLPAIIRAIESGETLIEIR